MGLLFVSLSDNEIRSIAEWQPTQEGFGRDDPSTAGRIKAIADAIRASCDIGCELVEEDGLSNYFILFAYEADDVPADSGSRSVMGLMLYLSACAPVGVMARSSKCVGFRTHDPVELDAIIGPHLASSHLESVVLDAVRSHGYELLSRDDMTKPLPLGVEPFEYCHGKLPWDRVFHALFANTD